MQYTQYQTGQTTCDVRTKYKFGTLDCAPLESFEERYVQPAALASSTVPTAVGRQRVEERE